MTIEQLLWIEQAKYIFNGIMLIILIGVWVYLVVKRGRMK